MARGTGGVATLTVTELVEGLAAEHTAFAQLVASFNHTQWRTPTRCAGWQIRDVAAHVMANAADSADGRIGTRTPDEQAAAFREMRPEEVAGALAAAGARLQRALHALPDRVWQGSGAVAGRTIPNGVLTLWYDVYVHADDIRAALRWAPPTGPGLAASVHWVRDELVRLGWGHATLALDGLPRLDIGNGGEVITGDPRRFVLAASGRGDPAEFGLDAAVNVQSLR